LAGNGSGSSSALGEMRGTTERWLSGAMRPMGHEEEAAPMPGERVGPVRRRVPRTKIMVPDPPVQLVSRSRLLRVLDQARNATVTVLRAPAGTGKTVLLAQWARRQGAADISWVSLDADDDDCRFWSAVLDALSANASVPDGSPLKILGVPAQPSTDLAFLAEVVDALDALPEPVVLVLDDVQELSGVPLTQGLRALVRHRPAGLRLVLSSRRDPPVSLARLRLTDQVHEVGAAELRFTLAEARALFAVTGAVVPSDGFGRLVEATEGWAVGLRMAAASVVREGNADEFLAGHDRIVQDYLTEEVLSPLRDDQREVLRAISGCEEVTAGLAGILCGRSDTEGLLHELSGEAIIATVPGGQEPRYRMPALLRSYLLAELGRREPERMRALHTEAARWFAAQGRPADALAHAARARDGERVAELVREHAIDLFVTGGHDVLRQAVGVLDDRIVAGDPLLALLSASLHLELGETDAADLQLIHADAHWPARPPAEVQVLRQLAHARRAQINGDRREILRAAQEVDAGLARMTGLSSLAALHAEKLGLFPGDRFGARSRLDALLDNAERKGQYHVVTCCLTALAELAAVEGDINSMTLFARTADTHIHDSVQDEPVEGATVCVMLAYGALLRAEPEECLREVMRLANVPRRPPPAAVNLHLVAETLRGAAEFELGAWHDALRRMSDARTTMGAGALSAEFAALCAVLEHRAALLLGAGEQAREVARWAQATLDYPGEPLLLRARTQFALGRHVAARKVLAPLLSGQTRCALPWTVLEGMLTGVRIALRDGMADQARRLLDRMLSAAEATDVWYSLVFATPDVIEALTASLGRLGPHDRIATQVLVRRRGLALPAIPPPLTERELSVLRLLPTMRSIDEIAEDLTVSPNTVKTHVRGIYTKLNVRRRRDAVAAAVTRGLLHTDAVDTPE
jgi:LuxR family transcriptional regulator, maltose regulon positive regulatory protein